MDPDTCLEEIRLLISEGVTISDEMARINYEAVAEKIQNLDAWLSHGGFLPKAWNNAFERKE